VTARGNSYTRSLSSMRIDDFDYHLPAGSIAQAAIEPRDTSRVLVASDLSELRFRDIALLMHPNDLLVVNRTKVRSARLVGRRKPTGGKTEVLLTKRIDRDHWQALVKPSKKIKVGTIVECAGLGVEVLSDPVNGVTTVSLTCDGNVESVIETVGTVPLPPVPNHVCENDRLVRRTNCSSAFHRQGDRIIEENRCAHCSGRS